MHIEKMAGDQLEVVIQANGYAPTKPYFRCPSSFAAGDHNAIRDMGWILVGDFQNMIIRQLEIFKIVGE